MAVATPSQLRSTGRRSPDVEGDIHEPISSSTVPDLSYLYYDRSVGNRIAEWVGNKCARLFAYQKPRLATTTGSRRMRKDDAKYICTSGVRSLILRYDPPQLLLPAIRPFPDPKTVSVSNGIYGRDVSNSQARGMQSRNWLRMEMKSEEWTEDHAVEDEPIPSGAEECLPLDPLYRLWTAAAQTVGGVGGAGRVQLTTRRPERWEIEYYLPMINTTQK